MTSIADKLDVLKDDLKECRTNIATMGGYITSTAGFKTVADEILNLPVVQNVGTLVDNSVAYRKDVPLRSVSHCYLNSIGGMTYKGFTFDCTVQEFNGEYSAPYSFTFPKAFTFPTDDPYAFVPVVCGRTDAPIGDASGLHYTLSGTTITGQGTIFNADIPVGTQLRCIPRFENQETGEYWFPPDCYTDLRDAKPTAVVSYGANLIPFPYYFSRSGFGEMDVGFTKEWAGLTFTINADRSISVKGTATGTPSFVLGEYIDFPKEDMYLSANMVGTVDGRAYVYTTDETGAYYTTDVITERWVKLPKEHNFSWVGVQIISGTTIDATFYPMLNTGSSALPYSPYFEKTYTLPTAITDKLGKGYDATLFNEYSFVDKKAVERVKSTKVNGDMITGFYEGGAVTSKSRYQLVVPVSDMKILNGYTQYGKILTPFFPNVGSVNSANANQTNLYQVAYTTLSDKPNLFYYLPLGFFGDTTADYSKGKAWFNSAQLPIVYEKETYTEETIPTDFNPLIEVEAGGYLEFVNEHGYPVPSTVTFQIVK